MLVVNAACRENGNYSRDTTNRDPLRSAGFCDTFSALQSCGVQWNGAFKLSSTIALGHYRIVFTDLHLLRISVLDGVVQTFRNQKHFFTRMLRTVRESCGIKTTHPSDFTVAKTCCPWLLYCLVRINKSSTLWPLSGYLGPSSLLSAFCKEPPWLKGYLF